MMVSKPASLQRETGVAAAIVEFDALADAVRAAAENDDLFARRGARLAGRDAGERRLIGRIHIGRRRGEFGRAGVDALEDRAHVQACGAAPPPPPRACRSARPAAHRKSPPPSACADWRRLSGRPKSLDLLFQLDDFAHARDEPGVDLAGVADLSRRSCPCASPAPTTSSRSGVGVPSAPRNTFMSSPLPSPSISISSRPVRPVSSERSAFCSDSAKVRPIAMASPTDFIAVVRIGSAPGNFSKAKRGIFVTT